MTISSIRRRIPFPSERVRRAVRRNRAGIIALFAVAALVVVLNGLGWAGVWAPPDGYAIGAGNMAVTPPGARWGAASTFDEARGNIVIFGGFRGADPAKDWNNEVIRGWITGGPFANALWMPLVNGLLTQAGQQPIGPPPPMELGDTWTYNEAKNNERWASPKTPRSPSPRGFAAMAYDDARKNVVLFGGGTFKSNPPLGDTWVWDGGDWTLKNPPEPRPPARQNASMVYDAHRKVVVMFGGRSGNLRFDDTWTWDGSVWTKLSPAASPAARHSAAMAYDLCRAETVMFGGAEVDQGNDQTWTFDGTIWTKKESSGISPPPRYGASMVYSPITGRMVLYGGFPLFAGFLAEYGGLTAGPPDPSVWYWDGSQWERDPGTGMYADPINICCSLIPYPTFPPPRAYASFTFDIRKTRLRGYPILGGQVPISLLGGTPGGAVGLLNLSGLPPLAFADHWQFGEHLAADLTYYDQGAASGLRSPEVCASPVPIPSGELPAGPAEEKKEVPQAANNDIHQTGKLPVLLGTHIETVPAGASQPACLRRATNPSNVGNKENQQNTHLVTDQKRNRVYQFFECEPIKRGANYPIQRLLIEAYDGSTLKPLGSAVIRVAPYGDFISSRVLHDSDRGRFLLRDDQIFENGDQARPALFVIQQDLIEKGLDPLVEKISLEGAPLGGGGITFFNHPATGRAKLLITVVQTGSTAGPPPSQGGPPKLVQWDLRDRREDWRVELTGCAGLGPTNAMRVENRAYVVCHISSNRYGVTRIPVVEDPTTPGGERAGTLEMFPGPFSVTRAWYDSQAERVVLETQVQASSSLYAFDGKASRYVGRANIAGGFFSSPGYGFDEETGRLYVVLPDWEVAVGAKKSIDRGGLKVFDTRLTPIPQPTNFSQFAHPGSSAIAVLPSRDGLPRRMFLRLANYETPSVYPGHPHYQAQAKATASTMKTYPEGTEVTLFDDMDYRVLADEMAIPEQPSLSGLDSLTVPVAEDPKKTEATFDAEGSGYGLRLRVVGGIAQNEYLAGHPTPACLKPDRELMVGWVSRAQLSDIASSARSLGLEVDSNSKIDLVGPLGRCNPPVSPSSAPAGPPRQVMEILWPLLQLAQVEGNKAIGSGLVEVGKAEENIIHQDTPLGTLDLGKDEAGNPTAKLDAGTGTAWQYHFQAVECSGNQAPAPHNLGEIHASTTCKENPARVEGTARARSAGYGEDSDTAAFSVGEAYSKVVVERDPAGKGVVVTSIAIAKAIKLGPISIDRVETRAVSWSNGRPGEDRASFQRFICGVQTPDGQVPNGCLTAKQQQDFVNGWNSGWGFRGKMILPKYDLDYYLGSPGGYIAGVTKPVADEVEDQLFALDYNKEVAGLVVEFTLEQGSQLSTPSPRRQVLALAGVRAVAALGVQCQFHLMYSPTAKDCIDRTDDLAIDEYEEEEEFFDGEEYEEEELDSGWTEIEPLATGGESLGSKIGKFLGRLPVLRQLPIRDIGEAILAGSVWWLLGLPIFLASRRFALNFGRTA